MAGNWLRSRSRSSSPRLRARSLRDTSAHDHADYGVQSGPSRPPDISASTASARVRPRCRQNHPPAWRRHSGLEAVAADPVETSEGGVELFAEILREAGALALNEAILGAVQLPHEVDGRVEPRKSNGGQEAGLQEIIDQVLAAAGGCSSGALQTMPTAARNRRARRHHEVTAPATTD